MPPNIEQPADLGPLPRLHDEKAARLRLRLGHNKWQRERAKIEHIRIGGRRFYTDAALLAYFKQVTVKPPKHQAESRTAGAP